MEELKIAAVQFSPEFESRVKEMVSKSGKKVSRPAVYKAKYFLDQHTDIPDKMQEKIILKSLEAALRTSQDNFEGTEFDHFDFGKKVALTCGENGISLKRIPTEIESEIQESFTGTNLSIRKSTVREAMSILDAQPDLTEEDKMNILIDSIEDTLEEQKMTDNYAGGEFDNYLFGQNFHDNLMDTREDKLIDREEEEFDRKDSFVAEEDAPCSDDWWWNFEGDPFDMESFSGNEYNNLFGLGNKKKKAERKAAKKERKAQKKEKKAERKIQRAEKAAAKGKTKKAARLLKKADKKLDKADKKRYKGDLKKIKAGIKVDSGIAEGRREVLDQQAEASGITAETKPEVNVVSQQLAAGAVNTEPTPTDAGGAMGGGGGGGGGGGEAGGGEEAGAEEGAEEGAPEAAEGDIMSKLKDNKMLLGIGAVIVVIILILILRK